MDYNEFKENRKKEILDFMDKFGDAVNVMGRDKGEFREGFARQHRTLQQSIFGVILDLILFASSDEYQTDGRNEYTKKMAKMLVSGYAEEYKKEEIERLKNLGYDEDVAEERAEAYKKETLKNLDVYFTMPCV